MRRFENILVGVDLSGRDSLVGTTLNRHASRAFESALNLAKHSDACLHFLYALGVSVDAQERIQRDRGLSPTLLDIAEDRMKGLVDDAKRQGITAAGSVVFGRSWPAIIRQVLKGGHDLVMVGTRQLGTVKSALLGSIGVQLLRKCPCPVWISKSPTNGEFSSILLANDQTGVGDLAMELAANLAELHSSELHILHSLEGYTGVPGLPSQLSVDDVVATKERIAIQISEAGLTRRAQVKLARDSSFCSAISEHIAHHGNDLLVLGTQECGGISRMIKRDRCERLLSRVPCSLLAVKAASFVAPLSLDNLEVPAATIGAT